MTGCVVVTLGAANNANAQQAEAQPAIAAESQNGQQLVQVAAKRIAEYKTVASRLRVRTHLMGQQLVGSGEYAQLESSAGLLVRMELAIQAGEQATSVRQISDGRDLWEHWRMAGVERVNHIDLRAVEEAIKQAPAGAITAGTSSNLAAGGLPKLLQQLVENFDFSKATVKSGRVGEVPVWFAVGVWNPTRLAAAAPQAVDGNTISFEKLPTHLPHQVELLLGKDDLFPYRVTYQRWRPSNGKHELFSAVTTEFFQRTLDEELDPSQFLYKRPDNVSVTDRTDAFLASIGLKPKPAVAAKPGAERSR